MQVQVLGAIERARYVAYGLAAGILLGMILGWLFHGFVGTLFRILIVIVILAPFVAAVIFWQRISGRNRVERSGRSFDDDEVITRESGPVRDAEWRERQ